MCQVVILASASNPNPSTLLQTHNGLTIIRIKRHKNTSQDKAFDFVSDSQRLTNTTTAKHLHFCPFEFWQSVVTSWTEGLWRDDVPQILVSLADDGDIWRNTKQTRSEMENTGVWWLLLSIFGWNTSCGSSWKEQMKMPGWHLQQCRKGGVYSICHGRPI